MKQPDFTITDCTSPIVMSMSDDKFIVSVVFKFGPEVAFFLY